MAIKQRTGLSSLSSVPQNPNSKSGVFSARVIYAMLDDQTQSKSI